MSAYEILEWLLVGGAMAASLAVLLRKLTARNKPAGCSGCSQCGGCPPASAKTREQPLHWPPRR